jgi:uncharacterized LabA/DUF88 family protein
MIFIDLRNIIKSVSADSKYSKVDYVSLVRCLKGPRKLIAAYVFDSKGAIDATDKSKRFHDYLRYKGFRVIARDSYDPDHNVQKEVDVAMAVQMVTHAYKNNYDVAVVVSGDRDFIPAIQEVQAAGKRVEVAAFSNSKSDEMERQCDVYHNLDKEPILSLMNISEVLTQDGTLEMVRWNSKTGSLRKMTSLVRATKIGAFCPNPAS